MIQCRELRLFPRLPAFFAGKKGSLWSSKNRTLAWWPRQPGHSDPGWSRKAWSYWLGAGEYQELTNISLLELNTANLVKAPNVLSGSEYLHALPHLFRTVLPQSGFFQRKHKIKKKKKSSWNLLGCFGNNQINENQLLPPRSSKQKGTKWPKHYFNQFLFYLTFDNHGHARLVSLVVRSHTLHQGLPQTRICAPILFLTYAVWSKVVHGFFS